MIDRSDSVAEDTGPFAARGAPTALIRSLLLAQIVSVQPHSIDLQVQFVDTLPIARSARFIMLSEQIDKAILRLQEVFPVAREVCHAASSHTYTLSYRQTTTDDHNAPIHALNLYVTGHVVAVIGW
jgi:hypothetical protein